MQRQLQQFDDRALPGSGQRTRAAGLEPWPLPMRPRIRALSATGRVAEAASYKLELEAHRIDRPARTFVLPVPLSRTVAPYTATL